VKELEAKRIHKDKVQDTEAGVVPVCNSDGLPLAKTPVNSRAELYMLNVPEKPNLDRAGAMLASLETMICISSRARVKLDPSAVNTDGLMAGCAL
jgi:hypothetical protein